MTNIFRWEGGKQKSNFGGRILSISAILDSILTKFYVACFTFLQVLIIDGKSCKILKSFKLSGNAIKSIDFARRGRYCIMQWRSSVYVCVWLLPLLIIYLCSRVYTIL